MASFTEVQHETLCHNLTMDILANRPCQNKSGQARFLLVKFASTSIEFQLLCRRGPISVEEALSKVIKQPHPGWKTEELGGLHFINVFSIRKLNLIVWYSHVFWASSPKRFLSPNVFVVGKNDDTRSIFLEEHFATSNSWRSTPRPQNQGSTKFYREKVGFSRTQHKRFWGDPSHPYLVQSLRLSTHEGALRAKQGSLSRCEKKKKNKTSFFCVCCNFYWFPNFHISCFFLETPKSFSILQHGHTTTVRSFIHFRNHGQMALCQAILGTFQFNPLLGWSSQFCKWLGSPPFISHEKTIWKGSHVALLRGLTITHGYYPPEV